jgi:putative oxidoreductase
MSLPGVSVLRRVTYPRAGVPLRRLFSTFAHGWPGAGLLVMRIVAGATLIAYAVSTLRSGPSTSTAILAVLTIAAGLLLLVGLWTPVAGSLVAVLGLVSAVLQPEERTTAILLAAIGAALALLGPGAWSIDARLFGWKRIDVRDRKR